MGTGRHHQASAACAVVGLAAVATAAALRYRVKACKNKTSSFSRARDDFDTRSESSSSSPQDSAPSGCSTDDASFAAREDSDEELLRRHQLIYEEYAQLAGDNAQAAAGINLAIAAKKAHRVIQAQRLLTTLVETSQRVNGANHEFTKWAASALGVCKMRFVVVEYGGDWRQFQVLRYTEDGRECAVQGPIESPRNVRKEKKHTFSVEDIHHTLGTPVICHGLDESPHLNHKVGVLDLWDHDTDRYVIRFEGDGSDSCQAKRENIRILFDLPDEKMSRASLDVRGMTSSLLLPEQ